MVAQPPISLLGTPGHISNASFHKHIQPRLFRYGIAPTLIAYPRRTDSLSTMTPLEVIGQKGHVLTIFIDQGCEQRLVVSVLQEAWILP